MKIMFKKKIMNIIFFIKNKYKVDNSVKNQKGIPH